MSDVNNVQGELVAAEDEADRGVTDLLAALDSLDRAITRIHQASAGSSQPGARDAIAHLEAAKSVLRDALKLVHTAIKSSQNYRRTI